MAKYRAQVLVTYVIEAESIDKAMHVVEFQTEFPVVPYEAGYYLTDELVAIEKEVGNDNE
jgi:hypothetical protein